MRPLTWVDAVALAAGLATGALSHDGAAKRRKEQVKQGVVVRGFEGPAVGALVGATATVAGAAMSNREAMVFGAGVGAGIAIHDLVYHFQRNLSFKPVLFLGEEVIADRWTRIIHIDPRLSVEKKEALILPLFRDLAAQSVGVPLCVPKMALPPEILQRLRQACAWLTHQLQIQPGNPEQLTKVQKWFHIHGVRKGGYEANEAMTSPNPKLRRPDVDRFRLLPLLLDTLRKKGKLEFDCDDGSLAVGAMAWYNGVPAYHAFVSQRPGSPPPLHHVFPVVPGPGGELWALETIKEIPPFPLSKASRVFNPLHRLTVMGPAGSYWDVPLR